MKEDLSIPGKVAYALGKGILAGLAGTLAITLSQSLEMKMDHRKPSTSPAKAARKVLDIKPVNGTKMKLANKMHWAYGTTWGIARGLLDVLGLKGNPATLCHFGAIWGTAMTMPPALKLSPPITQWKPRTVATGGLHHWIYSAIAGFIYDRIK